MSPHNRGGKTPVTREGWLYVYSNNSRFKRSWVWDPARNPPNSVLNIVIEKLWKPPNKKILFRLWCKNAPTQLSNRGSRFSQIKYISILRHLDFEFLGIIYCSVFWHSVPFLKILVIWFQNALWWIRNDVTRIRIRKQIRIFLSSENVSKIANYFLQNITILVCKNYPIDKNTDITFWNGEGWEAWNEGSGG